MVTTLETYFTASAKEIKMATACERQYKRAVFFQPLNFQKYVTVQKIKLLEVYHMALLKKFCRMTDGQIPPFPMLPP